MDYTFQFGSVWAAMPRLLDGARLTILLSVTTIVIGLLIGVVCALARTSRTRWLRWPAATYVEGSAMFRERGGSSMFARYAFNELVSFIAGWAILIDFLIIIALAALSVPHYLSPVHER